MIPFVDLHAQHMSLRAAIDRAIDAVIESGDFIKGTAVTAFESAFGDYCAADFCVGVGNGTDAIHLALRATGIGAGDVVYTAPNTFTATAEAIDHAGARVAFVDIDPDTWLIDIGELESGLDEQARAIVPVHLFGSPCNMGRLDELAARRGLIVVEDAAQAHGARVAGRRVGAIGSAGAFSFYPGKNLGALGDAGAIVTNDSEVATRARMLADHGRTEKYSHERIGWNSRLDTIQAAVLSVKLAHLDAFNERRRAIAAAYRARLEGVDDVRWPIIATDTEPVHHLLVAAVPRRDELRTWLGKHRIATGVHYPAPLHLQEAYRHLGYQRGDFPVAEALADSIISLPIYPELTESQVDSVCGAIRSFYAAD